MAAATVGQSGHPSQSAGSPASKISNQSRSGSPSNQRGTANQSGTNPGGGPLGTKTLSVSVSGSGSVAIDPGHGTCSQSCHVVVKAGSALRLVPSPADGFLLASWSGACSGSSSTCSVTMKTDQSVTATFNPAVTLTVRPRDLTITSDKGSINCAPESTCSATLPAQTTVTLTASTRAFWFGAPGCAQPQRSGSLGTKESVALLSPDTPQGGDGTSTTDTGGAVPPSTSTATPTPNTPTSPQPAGSATCQITLDQSHTVGAYPSAG